VEVITAAFFDGIASTLDQMVLLWQPESMKVTGELSDSDVKEICRITGESKIGPAIRKLVADALMLKRRELLAQKFITGEWGVELKGFEDAQAADKKGPQLGQ
jgi:hypothetical protein